MKSKLTKKGKLVQIADISVIVLVEKKTNNMFSHSDIVTVMWVPVHFWFEHFFQCCCLTYMKRQVSPVGSRETLHSDEDRESPSNLLRNHFRETSDSEVIVRNKSNLNRILQSTLGLEFYLGVCLYLK